MDLQRRTLIENVLARSTVSQSERLILMHWLVERVKLDESERKWLDAVDVATRPANGSLKVHHRTLIDKVLARPEISPSMRLVLMKWQTENLVLGEADRSWLEAAELATRPDQSAKPW